MSAKMNLVIIAGNLTRDPELRFLQSGVALCDFGLALNHSWRGEDGQEHEEVTFVDCTAWKKTAEIISQYLKKGSGALIQGRLKLDTWDDAQTGQKRSKLKVIVVSVQFTGAPRSDSNGGDTGRPQSGGYRQTARDKVREAAADAPPPEEDDVPF